MERGFLDDLFDGGITDDNVNPSDDWLAWGWGDYDLSYLDEVIGDFLEYLDDEGGYF